MKKIYLSALALSVATLSFGQFAKQNAIPFKTDANNTNKAVKGATQAPNDKVTVLYSDDFSNASLWSMTGGTPTNWTIGQVATGAGGFPLADLLSTSGAPFALFDSDAVNAGGAQDATIALIAPVNCSGEPNISIQFENYFRPFNTTLIYVEVATAPGGPFTQYQVHSAVPTNGATANPELTTVNISATAGNQAAVYIRFRYTGDWDYGWAIDDVSVQTTDDNDMVAGNPWYGFGTNAIQYTRIPQAQISDANFAMYTTNVGAVDQPNAVLTADVNGGTWTGTSTPMTNAVGATDSLFTTTAYTPANTIGVPLNFTLSVASDSTDASPGNNGFILAPVEISQYIYAHDDYGATPGNAGGYNTQVTPATEDFEAGSYFDIVTNDNVSGMEVFIGSNAVVGSILDVVLYDATTGFVQVERSPAHIVAAGEPGTLISIDFTTPAAVTAGTTYFGAVHGWGATGSEFFYGVSGSSPNNDLGLIGATSLIFYPSMSAPNAGENFFTTQTPMVRLNLAPLSVEEVTNDIKFNVYPNPSATGIFNISLDAQASNNANLTVTNVVGKTIINKTIAVSGKTVETISLTDYSKGIYFLTINGSTTKLIVD